MSDQEKDKQKELLREIISADEEDGLYQEADQPELTAEGVTNWLMEQTETDPDFSEQDLTAKITALVEQERRKVHDQYRPAPELKPGEWVEGSTIWANDSDGQPQPLRSVYDEKYIPESEALKREEAAFNAGRSKRLDWDLMMQPGHEGKRFLHPTFQDYLKTKKDGEP